ncbi:MAG: hypothetical protein ACXVBE_04700, partial [Bdellovibrionota bacterium]
ALAANDPERAAGKERKHMDTTPIFRCFADLPKIKNPLLQYKISDPSGRDPYEHLTKSKLGYAFNVKLDEFLKSDVNHAISIRRIFSDPGSGKKYEVSISPTFSCGPDGATPPNCQVKSISISVSYVNPPEKNVAATATFPITLDSSFEISLPLNESKVDEFRMDCAIASTMRKGGWIYSDEFLEEKK